MEIQSKKELRDVLNYERERWGRPCVHSWFGWLKVEFTLLFHPGSPYLYMYCLRNLEFNQRSGGGGKLLKYYYAYKLKKLGLRTGIELYPGCADKGVKVNHGKCVISKVVKIGQDSVILSDVTIGGEGGLHDMSGAASIGKRVFIGSGAKIMENVKICDNVAIGVNAVVVKDIKESGTVWGGVPARIISLIGDKPFIKM